MKKLVLESTSPFQGLPELVAYDEGLFEKEGLTIEWADRDEAGIKVADTSLTDVKGADPFVSHGTLLEQGKSDMYSACEWGNYCRAGATQVGSRQVGRRGIVTYGAIVVRPDSPVYTPQQLAGRRVGVPFYAGTHYLALHMLEGFLPRDQINVCRAPTGSRNRFNLMMKGEIEATTLTRALHLPRREEGLPRDLLGVLPRHRGRPPTASMWKLTRAFNRAVREAVRRINANKDAYLHYFIDYHKKRDPEIGTLKPSDLRAGRIIVVDPAPIPDDELQRTYEWVKSWGMLEETESPLQLVNMDVQSHAHVAAE